MPHLSPMNWTLSPLMFLIISTPMIMAYLWWSQTPNFPMIKSSKMTSSTSWNWE